MNNLMNICNRVSDMLDSSSKSFYNMSYTPWYEKSQHNINNHPKCDMAYKDDCLQIKAAVPGMTNDDLNVEVDNNNHLLSIIGSKTEESKDNKVLSEISTHSFVRSFSIDAHTFDINNINAILENGILSITIPRFKKSKKNKTNVKKIDINTK